MYPSNPIRLSLAQLPTPLQLLERTSAVLGGPRIWVKRDDLTGSVLTGNKVRKLEYLVADALSQSAQVLITSGGIQSNHCRATALVAAQQGLQSHLVMRGESSGTADGNLLLDQLAGASISCYPAAEYQARLPDLYRYWQEEYARQSLNAYVIPTGGSNAVGVWGYLEAAREMDEQFHQFGIEPDHVICASGSGGTQAGLSLGFALRRPQLSVLGFAVCDDEAYFNHKVAADIRAWCTRYQPEFSAEQVGILTSDRYIGPGYGQAEPAVYDTIAWLARTEGLVLDPVYTGKAFHGLVSEIRQGRFRDSKDIIFMHTGGVFGVFPHRDNFKFP